MTARNQTGLAHVAYKIGNSLDALKQAKADFDAARLARTAADHVVSKSLYLSDPDGNRIELYVAHPTSGSRTPRRSRRTSR